MKLFSFGLPLLALASATITRENFIKLLDHDVKDLEGNVKVEEMDAYKRLEKAGRPIAEGDDAIRRMEELTKKIHAAEKAAADEALKAAMKKISRGERVASESDDAVLQEYQRDSDEFDVLTAKSFLEHREKKTLDSYLEHKNTINTEVFDLKRIFGRITNHWTRFDSVIMTDDDLKKLAAELNNLDVTLALQQYKEKLFSFEFHVKDKSWSRRSKLVKLQEYKPVAVSPSPVVPIFKQKVTAAVGAHEDRKAHGDLLHEVHDKIHAADVSQESLKEIVAKLVEAEVHEELAELKEELMQIEITLKDAEGKEIKTNLAKIAASSVKKMSPGVIAAIVVIAVLVVGGAGAFLYFQRKP